MRIVDWKTFAELPVGTIFAKYKPCVFSSMMMKGDTLRDDAGKPTDFFCLDITTCFDSGPRGDYLKEVSRAERGESVPMDFDAWSRDAMYEATQLFAIYEPADLRGLIEVLQRGLHMSPQQSAPGRPEGAPADVPPADRSKITLTDGAAVTPEHREIDPATGMQKGYVVLSAEERARGFVRPVRRTYRHVGIRPKYPVRDLNEEEHQLYAGEAYVKYEEYPEGSPEKVRSAIGRFWTAADLNSGCQKTTKMSLPLAETYARDPGFYDATYCAVCLTHFPLEQFVWEGTNEVVGS